MLCINKIEAIACIYLISIFYHFSELRVSHGQWHLRIGWQRMWRGLIIKTKILSTRSPTATYTKKQHRPRNYSGEESSSCLSKMRTSLIYILWYVLWTYLLNWKERLTFMYTYVRSHLTIILEIQKVNGVCNNIFTTILLQKLFPKNKLTILNEKILNSFERCYIDIIII